MKAVRFLPWGGYREGFHEVYNPATSQVSRTLPMGGI
jgi:hypothetical protein